MTPSTATNASDSLGTATTLRDREIVSTRIFDAPRELVFEAFGDPDHLLLWWGPQGFTNTFHEFDLRPGGLWRFTMQGPDGAVYQNESVFTEVRKPERVVFHHLEPIHGFQMTMTFIEQGGKTSLTWRMVFDSAEECARVRPFVTDANEQNFDRLADQLARMASAGEPLVIVRVFDAPRSLVFKAWTDPEHLAHWYAPKGCTVHFNTLDLRPGGVMHFCHHLPGEDVWVKGVYREVVEPERIVFTDSFSDEAGNQVERPGYPPEMRVSVTFAEEDGKTKVTVRHEGLIADQGESQGWTEMLDLLAEHLRTIA